MDLAYVPLIIFGGGCVFSLGLVIRHGGSLSLSSRSEEGWKQYHKERAEEERLRLQQLEINDLQIALMKAKVDKVTSS